MQDEAGHVDKVEGIKIRVILAAVWNLGFPQPGVK